jgi:HAE1 family hydrophobic/amphiphilic exporter-1
MGVPLRRSRGDGTFMGSSYVNDFDFNNRSYRVYVQADQQFRRNAATCASTTCARIRTR